MMYHNPDLFCSAGEDLCLWTRSGQLKTSLQHRDDTNETINLMITIRNDRKVTAVDEYLSVYVVNETSDDHGRQFSITHVKKCPPHREAIKSLINVAEDRFASGSIDGTIIVWKTDTLFSLKFFNNVQDHEYKGSNNTFPYSVEQMICIDQLFISASHHFPGVGHMAGGHDNGIQSTEGDIDGSVQLFYSLKRYEDKHDGTIEEHLYSRRQYR